MEYIVLCVALAIMMIVFVALPLAIVKGISEWLCSTTKKKPAPENREASDEIMHRLAKKIGRKETENE
jgi:hypothetical protein